MPRKKPIIPKRKHYSTDLKRRVVYQRQILGKEPTEIAIDLDIPLRVVQRVMTCWNRTGEVCSTFKGGRSRMLSPGECEYILALLEHTPDLYLDELQHQLEQVHGVKASIPTIYRTMKRLGLSSKKLSRIACERSDTARHDFMFEIGQYPPEYLVFADESAVNVLTTYRSNGWSSEKIRARKRCCFVRGTRYSILPAITTEGIIYSHIKEGSYNGDQFLEWLEGLLPLMNAYPAPQSVLVMDNCRIHHVEGVEEMCHAHGIRLVYLPPYSPDLNPIEECFSFVKSYIRRHGETFRSLVETGDPADPYIFLYQALDQVKAEHSKGWFHHSGYL